MTEAASPDHPAHPIPPPKRRKVQVEADGAPLQNGDQDSPKPTSPPSIPHPSSNGTDKNKDPVSSPPNNDPVVRGPQVTGGLDELRPPRRTDSDRPPAAAPNPRHPSTTYQPSDATASSSAPTNLDPEVNSELSKIFASGLFERKDIDGRALDFLASVSPQLALAALHDIQRRDFSTVRNKPAFIMSIFKRVIAGGGNAAPPQAPPPGGYAPTSVPAAALAHLPPAVSDALQRVFASGVCHPSQFDDRAMDILVDLQEPDAVRALSEFAAMEPGRVRNPSAFWVGLARKYKGHSRAPGGRMGPGSIPPTSYGSYDGVGYRRMGPGAGGSAVGGGGASYSPALDQRLDELAATGALPRGVLDDRALDALRRLPEHDAIAVLAELPEPARVRNMSAYVMGLCKKFATGEARSLTQRGSSYGAASSAGYGAGGSYAGGYGGYNPGYGGGYGSATAAAGSYGAAYPSAQAGVTYPTSGYGVPPPSVPSNYGSGVPQQGGDQNRAREVRDAMEAMDPAVRERFYEMTNQGVISETAFDARAIGALQNMRSDEALAALDELAASEPGRIHNISAYFMGLAKKFSRPPM